MIYKIIEYIGSFISWILFILLISFCIFISYKLISLIPYPSNNQYSIHEYQQDSQLEPVFNGNTVIPVKVEKGKSE